jgi:predicted dienelactone hydrolase
MITVAGLASEGVLPDPRVKAVVPVDGFDYLGFSPADLANVSVPVLIFGSPGGQRTAGW